MTGPYLPPDCCLRNDRGLVASTANDVMNGPIATSVSGSQDAWPEYRIAFTFEPTPYGPPKILQ
ncbi:hypothetical protein ABIE00_000746 [Arthrobacter sp. OAP107]